MISVVWLMHDLRTHDHAALDAAIKSGYPVVCVYAKTFTHKRFNKNLSRLKEAYLNQTLDALKKTLEPYQIPLIVHENDIISALLMLEETMKIHAVYTHEVASIFERKEILNVKQKYRLHTYEGTTLIKPSELTISLPLLPNSFTSFRKKIERLFIVAPLVDPVLKRQDVLPFKSTDLDLLDVSLIVEAGETAGLKRLKYYLEDTHAIKTYKETRNGMERFDDSTKFSFYISLGALSVRKIYHEIKAYEKRFGKNDSTYWVIFELLWREFFKYQEIKDPFKMVSQKGYQNKIIHWKTNDAHLEAFKNAKTGYPLIDANITELKTTGYISNRGRQNVASFFVKNLGLDWQIGEAFFEHHLLDYDVASNMGNWQYITGIGHDSMPFRYFDVCAQGDRYDKNHAYLLKWLPHLKKVNPKDRYHLPKLSNQMFEMLPESVKKETPIAIVDFYESLNDMKKRYGVPL